MKFEIDKKTGMIRSLYVDLNHLIIGDNPINSTELEEILQAVKKTQAKLVNKQIQEIQDSKKPQIY